MNPAILNSRLRAVVLAGLVPLVIAFGVAVAVPKPNIALELTLALGALGIVVLITERRLELTVLLLALYLGLLDGPVKLGSGGHEAATVFRDVLIFAVSLGAVLRMLANRERIRLPPLSGWVVLFVALVVAEAFSPSTHGMLKALGGFRQQLEFVPFFFFGYALMRSKERFRKLFIVLGVIALANGIVSTYQTKLSPGQLASWGPGYSELVYGTQAPGSKGGNAARLYSSEGQARIRPPGLGKDAGFAGGVGLVALPCTLALLATTGRRKRWAAVLLCLGAMLGVVTGLGRLQVVGAVVAMIAFALLSASAGRRMTRPLTALLGVLVLAVPLGAILVSVEAPGTFNRYAEIAPGNAVSAKDKKTSELTRLPHQLSVAPFGVGLASAGAASGFGGKVAETFEGHGVGGETQYNFLADEVGLPGLLLWAGLMFNLILLAARRLRHIADVELRIDLAGVFAVLISMLLIGISGPVMGSAALGSFFWFTAGIGSYWFLGPGRAAATASRQTTG
ncbi:MAG: hypothetical protein JWN81_1440 [Solirubrobacterales bacterium]|jgi:hypothetical protein|nr:hypothetical protein [Solirubrobacterales bacterium]